MTISTSDCLKTFCFFHLFAFLFLWNWDLSFLAMFLCLLLLLSMNCRFPLQREILPQGEKTLLYSLPFHSVAHPSKFDTDRSEIFWSCRNGNVCESKGDGQNLSAHISLGALPSCIPREITPVNLQTQVQPDSQVQNNSETWMDGWQEG